MADILITGAAGFIGSHLTDRLLLEGHTVTGVDNLARGTLDNLRTAAAHGSFQFVETDLSTKEGCTVAFDAAGKILPIDTVWHLAANPTYPPVSKIRQSILKIPS